jgi:hypothetical protein
MQTLLLQLTGIVAIHYNTPTCTIVVEGEYVP